MVPGATAGESTSWIGASSKNAMPGCMARVTNGQSPISGSAWVIAFRIEDLPAPVGPTSTTCAAPSRPISGTACAPRCPAPLSASSFSFARRRLRSA